MRTWNVAEYRGWGGRISFRRYSEDGQRALWDGHTTPAPAVGDVFEAETKSGAIEGFRVVEVRRCFDPSDMWFAETLAVPLSDKPIRKPGRIRRAMSVFR